MGLGYEGWIGIDSKYALGTGTSVPRARQRLESASGYGGEIASPEDEMGLGLPYNYDYDLYEGSLSFEVSKQFYEDRVYEWLFDRQSSKQVEFSTRHGGLQQFDESFWGSISLSASEPGAVEGSLNFYALDRTTYTYGDNYEDDPSIVKKGNRPGGGTGTLICPSGLDAPPPLNENALNENPIPYWNTEVWVDDGTGLVAVEFINWSCDFSQDVVRFFASEYNTSAQPPKYLAVGPMTVTFSGSYMLQNGFLGDSLTEVQLHLDDKVLKLRRLEASTESDDVQSPDAYVPLTVEYAVYELKSA